MNFFFSNIDFSFATPLVNSTVESTTLSDIEEGPNPGEPIGDNTAINISLSQQLSSLVGGRYRFAVFFVFLLIAKVLIENVFPNVVLISGALVLLRLRKEHNLQLSAKKKSSMKILLLLLFFSIAELAIVFKFIQIYGSPNRIIQRLSFTYSFTTSSNQSELLFQHMFWCAIVLDGIVQMSVIALKLFLCAIFDFGVEIKFDELLKLAGSFKFQILFLLELKVSSLSVAGSFISSPLSTHNSSNRQHLFSESHSSSSSPSQPSAVVSPSILSSLASTATNAITASQTTHFAQSDDNISNSSSSDREAAQYLKKLRLCSLLDILGLLYRSILPTPAWMAYFSAATVGSSILSYLYLGFKVIDLL